jgi:hypothetical protein
MNVHAAERRLGLAVKALRRRLVRPRSAVSIARAGGPVHPVAPLRYAQAIAHVERWLEAEILTSDQRKRDGLRVTIYDYFDRRGASRRQRPWCGVRVAEVDFHHEHGGASFMQVDSPWGIAVCGQVERCILALIEAWNRDVGQTGSYETDEEFERLRYLFAEAAEKQEETGAATGAGQVLRIVVDRRARVAPEDTVRTGYIDESELAAALGVKSAVATAATETLRRGMPYHTRLEQEELYLIPAAALGAAAHGRARRPATSGQELRLLYDHGARGLADIDMDELLWRIFDDVHSSYALALRHAAVPESTVTEVTTNVEDYLANHYGSE